jgi:hypothetical protein
MTATPPAEPTEAGINVDQVRTTNDAATWLRQEAARHTAEATSESSPDQACALRGASSTLEVYAAVIGTYRDPAGIGAELGRLADDYRHPDRDLVEPMPDVHRLVCGHLADTLGPLAERLTSIAATQRPRTGHPARPAAGRSIDL